jgi:hypothetical protein
LSHPTPLCLPSCRRVKAGVYPDHETSLSQNIAFRAALDIAYIMGLASERTRYLLARIEPFGFFILIGLLYLGVLDSLIGFFEWVIVAVIKALIP